MGASKGQAKCGEDVDWVMADGFSFSLVNYQQLMQIILEFWKTVWFILYFM